MTQGGSLKGAFLPLFFAFCGLRISSHHREDLGKSQHMQVLAILSFIVPIFAWNVPLLFQIFLKRSLVFPFLLFFSISLHCSLKKAFLSLLPILWNSAFSWVYLSLYALPISGIIQCLSFWFISFHMITSRSIHGAANGIVSFFLWLNNIPLYICTTSSLFMHLLMDT